MSDVRRIARPSVASMRIENDGTETEDAPTEDAVDVYVNDDKEKSTLPSRAQSEEDEEKYEYSDSYSDDDNDDDNDNDEANQQSQSGDGCGDSLQIGFESLDVKSIASRQRANVLQEKKGPTAWGKTGRPLNLSFIPGNQMENQDSKSIGSTTFRNQFELLDVASRTNGSSPTASTDLRNKKRPVDCGESTGSVSKKTKSIADYQTKSSWDVVSRAQAAATNTDEESSSWDLVKGGIDHASARDGVYKSAPSKVNDTILHDNGDAWIYLDDDHHSVAESTITEATKRFAQPDSSVQPKFDFLGVELDLGRDKSAASAVDDDLSVSLGSTIFATGGTVCSHCTLVNRSNVGFCEACGLPLSANPSPQIDEQLAMKFAHQEYKDSIARDEEVAKRLSAQEEEGNEVYNTPEEGDSARESFEYANDLRDILLKLKLPGELAALNQFKKGGLAQLYMAQSFFALRAKFQRLGKSTHVCTGFYHMHLTATEGSYSDGLAKVCSSMKRLESGKADGIRINYSPFTHDTQMTTGVLCLFIKGACRKYHNDDVDSIVFPETKQMLLKRADQCLPLVMFEPSLYYDKGVSVVLGNMDIVPVQRHLQGAIDWVFNSCLRTRLESLDLQQYLAECRRFARPEAPTLLSSVPEENFEKVEKVRQPNGSSPISAEDHELLRSTLQVAQTQLERLVRSAEDLPPCSHHPEIVKSSNDKKMASSASPPLEASEGSHAAIVPEIYDVLCGQVHGADSQGNRNYRRLVSARREAFNRAASSDEKRRIVRQVLDGVGALKPGGRFLEKVASGWKEVCEATALDKIERALSWQSSHRGLLERQRESIQRMLSTNHVVSKKEGLADNNAKVATPIFADAVTAVRDTATDFSESYHNADSVASTQSGHSRIRNVLDNSQDLLTTPKQLVAMAAAKKKQATEEKGSGKSPFARGGIAAAAAMAAAKKRQAAEEGSGKSPLAGGGITVAAAMAAAKRDKQSE